MIDFREKAQQRFDDATVAKLALMLKLSTEADIAAFKNEALDLCAHYQAVIAALPCDLPQAPFNLSLTKRADWLEANVLNPAERLLRAISDEMRPMFCEWPYPLSVPEFADRTSFQRDLLQLREQANSLTQSLRSQQSDDAGHSQELRAEIFASIARLVRHHSHDLKPSRGVYDPVLRRREGLYVEVIRVIFAAITGVEENIDRLIRAEIDHPS